jgi:hypothetical protein
MPKASLAQFVLLGSAMHSLAQNPPSDEVASRAVQRCAAQAVIPKMSIAQEIFEAFLKCPTKAYLYSARAVGIQSESREWQRHQQEEFKQTGWRRLRSSLRTGEWYEGTLPLQALEQRSYRLILDYKVVAPELHARLTTGKTDGTTTKDLWSPLRPPLRSTDTHLDDFRVYQVLRPHRPVML